MVEDERNLVAHWYQMKMLTAVKQEFIDSLPMYDITFQVSSQGSEGNYI
jgi:hypothetical protein